MPALDLTSAVPDPVDDDLVEAGVYATAEQGAAHGLVVLATGNPYWLEESPSGHRLLIERRAAVVARRHLIAYDQESRRWPTAACSTRARFSLTENIGAPRPHSFSTRMRRMSSPT